MKTKLTESTNKHIESELYKVCAGEDATSIMGYYKHNSIWGPHDILKVLIHACSENTSIEDICYDFPGPSADTVHRRVNELQLDQIEQLINNLLREIVSRLVFHANTKLTVSFDGHDKPYYGNINKEWVTGMKRKDGTNWCTKFTIVSITTGTIRCPVYVKLMTKDNFKDPHNIVCEILDNLQMWLPIRRVLMDRWYHQRKIIDEINFRGLKFVIAAKKIGIIKQQHQLVLDTIKSQAKIEGIDTNDKLALGRWARKKGLNYFWNENAIIDRKGTRASLVMAFLKHKVKHKNPLKRETYNLVVYLTNIKVNPEQIVKIYDRRWLIETDIRCVGVFKAISNSRKGNVRFLLFGFAAVLDALWVVTTVLMNRIIEYGDIEIIEETIFLIYQRDSLLIIARRFKRYIRTKILLNFSFQGGDA